MGGKGREGERSEVKRGGREGEGRGNGGEGKEGKERYVEHFRCNQPLPPTHSLDADPNGWPHC